MDELDSFSVDDGDDEVAFSIKEVKALLQFCDNHDVLSISVQFSAPGESLLITSELGTGDSNQGENRYNNSNSTTFTFELVMATLETEETAEPQGEADEDVLFSVDSIKKEKYVNENTEHMKWNSDNQNVSEVCAET